MMTEKCITFLAMGWNKRRAALTVALQIFTVALSLGGVIAYCIFQLSTHSTIEKQITMFLANGSVTYTIIYSIMFFPWWSFKKIEDNENDNEEGNKDDDEENKRNINTNMSRRRSL